MRLHLAPVLPTVMVMLGVPMMLLVRMILLAVVVMLLTVFLAVHELSPYPEVLKEPWRGWVLPRPDPEPWGTPLDPFERLSPAGWLALRLLAGPLGLLYLLSCYDRKVPFTYTEGAPPLRPVM